MKEDPVNGMTDRAIWVVGPSYIKNGKFYHGFNPTYGLKSSSTMIEEDYWSVRLDVLEDVKNSNLVGEEK